MLETLDWRIAQLQLFIYFWEGRGGEERGVGWVWGGRGASLEITTLLTYSHLYFSARFLFSSLFSSSFSPPRIISRRFRLEFMDSSCTALYTSTTSLVTLIWRSYNVPRQLSIFPSICCFSKCCTGQQPG